MLEPACGLPCLRARVCGPAGNKSGHSSPEVYTVASEKRSFHLPASRDPGGDHMPEPGRESFCVINTRSLEVPCWPEIQIQRGPIGGEGSQRNLSEVQIAVCHRGKTVKKHYSANYKLTGPLDPPSPPTYCHPSFTSTTSLNSERT